MARTKSILVVDDELSVRESLKMILKPIYQVYTAVDGQQALQFIQNDKIDLVALDLKMPGLSGIEVLQRIKENDPDIEVIIITAHRSSQNIQDASQYGAGDFFTKPFNVFDLIGSIKKSLEKRSHNLRLKNFSRYNSAVIQR